MFTCLDLSYKKNERFVFYKRSSLLLCTWSGDHVRTEWVQTLSGLTSKTIAIDGKQIRGSKTEKSALTLVSAWAGENKLVLAQERVHGKSNEITAIPKLLELLDLKGKIVTIDAIGTQRAIAKQIIDAGGDYVLAVKKNQGNLYQEMKFFSKRIASRISKALLRTMLKQ